MNDFHRLVVEQSHVVFGQVTLSRLETSDFVLLIYNVHG